MDKAVALLGLSLAGCVGGDVWVDLGPDLTSRRDLTVVRDLGPPGDLVSVPDLTGFAPPPDPYKPGTPRLSIGAFYEGGSSEAVPVDNNTSHVYIYPNGNSVVLADDSDDKLEGYQSQSLTVAGGLGWFGLGVHWDKARDLSAWKTLHLALKSSSASMSDVTIGINSPMANPQTSKRSAKSYGYTNDGAWHSIAIPLADFAAGAPALDAKQVAAPLVIVNAGAVKDGDVVRIDDVYFE